ncbi:ComF family protein [Streptomyces sp. NBC_00237]|uniref:ComF family protein n=1 Tax=Streptomyces sp. NBC_00237 TaxID=2975687 RepID=UPI0022588FC1|nr:ComF family protein [Streptomyces sp. NBC_00237]MCX5200849.1 ComF family protein [Streptomyces sp. NBC_00237]
MRVVWREFAALVLPVACAGCGRPREPSGVCAECAGALYGGEPGRVRPMPEPPGLPVVHAAAWYEDAPRAVLLAHKERGALGLAEALGRALAGAVRSAAGEAGTGGGWGGEGGEGEEGEGEPPVAYPPAGWVGAPPVDATQELVLVPVPSARRSVAARGQDPARRIAFAAAGELRRSGTRARVAPVLRQCRPVGDQAGLSAPERLANLSGALDAVPGAGRLLVGGRVVLVDDLMTTGASLVEGARALKALADEYGPGGPAGGYARRRGRPGRSGEYSRAFWGRPGNTGIPQLVAAVVAAPPKSFKINWN